MQPCCLRTTCLVALILLLSSRCVASSRTSIVAALRQSLCAEVIRMSSLHGFIQFETKLTFVKDKAQLSIIVLSRIFQQP